MHRPDGSGALTLQSLVEMRGIEPLTPALQMQCVMPAGRTCPALAGVCRALTPLAVVPVAGAFSVTVPVTMIDCCVSHVDDDWGAVPPPAQPLEPSMRTPSEAPSLTGIRGRRRGPSAAAMVEGTWPPAGWPRRCRRSTPQNNMHRSSRPSLPSAKSRSRPSGPTSPWMARSVSGPRFRAGAATWRPPARSRT
jgi:hypothetical protein